MIHEDTGGNSTIQIKRKPKSTMRKNKAASTEPEQLSACQEGLKQKLQANAKKVFHQI